MDELRREFHTWDEFNEQLLRSRFSTTRLAAEYRLVVFSFGGASNPQREFEEVRRDLAAQRRKLESIRQRLGLYESRIDEEAVSSSPAVARTAVVLSPQELGEVEALLTKIRQADERDELSLREEDRAELEAEMATIEAQIRSPRPKRQIVADAIRTLGSILTQASAAVLGAGALDLAQHLLK